MELLNEFKEHYHPPLFTSKDLAILFEKLLIFGKLEEGAWFVPSILPSLEEEEVEQYCEKKERALVIYFPDGGPKNGIFCSSVSFLLSNDNTSPAPWKVLKVSGNPVCLKHNVIIFTVGDFYGKVTLVEKWTHFELYVNTDEDNEEDLWKLVYNAVFNGLTKAAETHHYSDTDNIPQAAIICCEQDKDHPSTPHPATIKRQKGKWMWTCTKSQQWGGKVSGNIPWLNLGIACMCVYIMHVCVHWRFCGGAEGGIRSPPPPPNHPQGVGGASGLARGEGAMLCSRDLHGHAMQTASLVPRVSPRAGSPHVQMKNEKERRAW